MEIKKEKAVLAGLSANSMKEDERSTDPSAWKSLQHWLKPQAAKRRHTCCRTEPRPRREPSSARQGGGNEGAYRKSGLRSCGLTTSFLPRKCAFFRKSWDSEVLDRSGLDIGHFCPTGSDAGRAASGRACPI